MYLKKILAANYCILNIIRNSIIKCVILLIMYQDICVSKRKRNSILMDLAATFIVFSALDKRCLTLNRLFYILSL